MANLASLVAKVEATSAGLIAELDKANSRLEGLQKTAEKTEKFSAASAAAAVMNIGKAVYNTAKKLKDFVMAQAEVIVSQYRFARSIGDSVANVLELQSAMRMLGGEAEDINGALLTIGKTLSKAQSDQATNNIFNRLGLDIDKLKQKKPSDAFIDIAEALRKIDNPGARAALATQIFGDKAKDLLPLLDQGAEGIEKLRDKAVEFGQSVNDIEASAVEKTVEKLDELGQRLEGIGKQLAVKAAMRSWSDDISDYFKIATTAGEAAFINFGILALKIFKGIANAAGKLLPTESLRKEAKDASLFVKGMIEQLEGDVAGLKQEGQSALDRINGRNAPDKLPGIKAKETKAKADERTARGAVPKAIFDNERFARGLEIIKEFDSPLNKFQNRIKDLNLMLRDFAIDQETYFKAVAKAVDEMAEALGDKQINFAGAVKANSAEAYSAQVRNQRQGEQYREDPQKRVERLQMEMVELQKQQLAQAKRLADAVGNSKPVKI